MQDKARYVNEVFNTIAPGYDKMNLLMTWGMLPFWQKKVMKETCLNVGDRGLDVCCGTGEMAFRMAEIVGPFGEVVGLDFSREMLAGAELKKERRGMEQLSFIQGDALDMPLPSNGFDAATNGFALRNVTDIAATIAEMARVVRPGGRVICMEVSRPVFPPARLFFNFYYYKIVPKLGDHLVSRQTVGGSYTPYHWLAESLRNFPNRRTIKRYYRDAGLVDVKAKPVGFGAVTIYTGTKPTQDELLQEAHRKTNFAKLRRLLPF